MGCQPYSSSTAVDRCVQPVYVCGGAAEAVGASLARNIGRTNTVDDESFASPESFSLS